MTLCPNPLRWPLPEWEEMFERSAIIEADTGCSREEADRRAEAIVRRRVELAERVVYPAITGTR